MPRIFAGHFSLLVELKLEKSVIDLRESYLPGDKVRCEFIVTNTGDVTIRELAIVDLLLAGALLVLAGAGVLVRRRLAK